MKRIDELVNEAYPKELTKVKPMAMDEEAVRSKTFAKLGLSNDPAGGEEPDRGTIETSGAVTVKKRRGLRATLASVGAMAACIVALLTINAAFPAFAESIPGLGGLFRAINEHNRPYTFNGENVSRVEERMAPVSEVKTATGEGGLSFAVQEAYYDGKYLYCAAQIETALDPNAEKTEWEYQIYINGVKLDFDYRPFGREWVKTGENTYANDEMSTQIPEEFRPETPGDIQVKYEVTFYDHSHTLPPDDPNEPDVVEIVPEVLASATAEFTAKYDPGETIEFESTAEQNGVKLLSFSTSPSSTEVVMDVPHEVSGYVEGTYANIVLFCMDGKQINLNSGSGADSDLTPGQSSKMGNSGEGVPRGEKKVVAMLMYAKDKEWMGEGEVAAEFTIDLEEKTAAPSELWKDPDGSLYWNAEADLTAEPIFTSYRAPDSALEELKNGYRVEFLCHMDGYPSPLLNLVTDQDFRELHVEMLDEEGVVWASCDTMQTQELSGYFISGERVMFQPFAEYDYSDYDAFKNRMERATEEELAEYRKHFGEKRLSHLTGGEIPREMDKSGLNSQTVFLEWGDGFPLVGDKFTVRLTDPKTGELVHEETVEMSLPENLELEEGQRVVKLRGSYSPYVIIDAE